MKRRERIDRIEEAFARARKSAGDARAGDGWQAGVMAHVRALGPHRAAHRDAGRADVAGPFRRMAWASAALAAVTIAAGAMEFAQPETALAWLTMGDATGFLSVIMGL